MYTASPPSYSVSLCLQLQNQATLDTSQGTPSTQCYHAHNVQDMADDVGLGQVDGSIVKLVQSNVRQGLPIQKLPTSKKSPDMRYAPMVGNGGKEEHTVVLAMEVQAGSADLLVRFKTGKLKDTHLGDHSDGSDMNMVTANVADTDSC
ncbi:hypothetical protein BDD12DRAFT_809350 [Trichophaea hybrida]|nr:hypothetical protein BDD12DRAFT_809350 [Trichophaea hybrida]